MSAGSRSSRALRNDAGDVSRLLALNIQRLAPEILPAGKRLGQEWRVGGVDGAPGGSCAVHLAGRKAGGWVDFTTGESGDALDLVAAVLFRGDRKGAYAWSRAWLGLGGTAPAIQRAEPAPSKDAAAESDYRASALRLYLSAQPNLAGTPADFYLRQRGIDLSRLGRQPRALRYMARCRCTEAGEDLPALIAAVTDADGRHVATHRTWLAQHDGRWTKARLQNPKKTLGRVRGGTIRLWRGASNKPLRHAPTGETVVIGEGIETCLSVVLCCPEFRTLCAVSLSNMANVELPDQLGPIIVLGDNDTKESARAGFVRTINALLRSGRDVRVARSPAGKDFNDAMLMERAI